MIARNEILELINRYPKFADIACSLQAIKGQPSALVNEAKEVIAIARKFNQEIAKPLTLSLDRKMQQDSDFLTWDFVKKANAWGLYTLFLPKIFGGKGYNFSVAGYFLEELASVCLSLANLVAFHYLGFAGIISTWNVALADRISRQVIEGEKCGDPRLISFAMTEPDAGTDSQNVEFMDTGTLACHAKKVKDGYVVNGTKVFISGGHFATWHVLFAYTDPSKGSETMVALVVRKDSKGHSLGRIEKKMGQKVCPASELIFEDCFIPDENVLLDKRHTARFARNDAQTTEQVLAYIWASSRMGVGAMGAGAARGAYECALKFAAETELDGRHLINCGWCQSTLSEMYKNAALARLAYVESSYANGLFGLWKPMNFKPLYYATKFLPLKFFGRLLVWIYKQSLTTQLFQKLSFDLKKDEELDRVDGWGSLAKVAGSDAAMENCRLALEIMGQNGIRQDQLLEKIYRDSKLLQIYEGTNQVNRINLFKRLVAKQFPGTICFPSKTEN